MLDSSRRFCEWKGCKRLSYEISKLGDPSEEHIKTMHAWQSDSAIRHLFNVFKNKEEYEQLEIWQTYKKDILSFKGQRFGIFSDEQLVGEFNYVFDHDAALKKSPKTAWIGIVIGEESARGRGLGQKAIACLEQDILSKGGKRIELGVFEFNEVAIKLYEKLGYKKFKTIPDFTWWNEKRWADLRYEKFLGQ